MVKKEFLRAKVADLIPYERNPRKIPQSAVDDVVESIRQCGPLDPIEVDEANVILSGHTRRLAYMQAGIEEADIIRYTGMTAAQKKKYRLLANKTGEKSGWDFDLLDVELDGLDFEGYDFGFEIPDEVDLDDFFDRGVETKAKEELFGVKVICGTEQQRDDLIEHLEELGYAPKAL